MKALNLRILKENGFPVPDFVVTDSANGDFSYLPDKKYAVRSSSESEDGDTESHAGQFLTLLNVHKNDLKDAVQRVLDSGKRSGSEMRVIIQEMIDSDVSGVMFTANPLGILNEAVIVLGKGLGENVVEDRVNTTSIYYNLDDDIFYHERQEDSVLPDKETVRSLIGYAKKIRDLFQKEMDIEFAVKDGSIYILQARPITTLHYEKKIILDNSNIVESYPGISLPLTQSFVKEIYRDIFRAMVLRLTGNKALVKRMEPVFSDMVMEANGRVYYNISNWYNVLSLMPFSWKIISVWQEMLGVEKKEISVDFRATALEKSRVLFSFLKYLHSTPYEMEKLNEKFSALYPQYIRRIRGARSISELLQVYDDIDNELIPLWDITLINDMYAFIYTHFAAKRHPDEIADIKDLESMRPVRALNEVIRIAAAKGMDSGDYKAQRERYINKYGDRCLEELKLETRTYRTDPELLDKYVKSRLKEKAAESPRRVEKADVSFTVKRAKTGIANRERSRMNRTRIFGMVRYIVLSIGKILKEQGKLAHERDVFYLTLKDIRDEAVSPKRSEEYMRLVSDRKRKYKAYSAIPAYSRLVYGDRIVSKNVTDISVGFASESRVLSGISSSPGCVTGEVIVIENADHLIDTKGKIIVTKMTDPGWVFLIKPSLGIIAEKGSMLSHTAIITRELHKPSIVNVKDAAKILKTGDRITLDAFNGTVTFL